MHCEDFTKRRRLHLPACLLIALLVAGCSPGETTTPKHASGSEPAATAGGSAAGAGSTPEPRGDEPPADSASQDDRAEEARPFLWAVRTQGQTSHMLGTTHVGVALEDVLAPEHRERIRTARTVWLEADVESLDPSDARELVQMPGDERLDDMVAAEVWTRLTKLLRGLPQDKLARFKPWATAMTLTQFQVFKVRGRGMPRMSMDKRVLSIARNHGVDVEFLETPEQQVRILDSIPRDTHIAQLEEAVRNPAEQRERLRSMFDAYESGDTAAMEKLVFDPEEMEQYPDYYRRMFFERNEAWRKKLMPELRKGGAFVAVGLGHLLGERGLVAQLRQRDLQVERLR
jgi:hypothetical protein